METLPVGNQTVTPAETKPIEKLTQKDAVYTFMMAALDAKGLTLNDTVKKLLRSSKKDLTDDEKKLANEIKKAVRVQLKNSFEKNLIILKSEKTGSELVKYCSGLVNNWIKKDERFDVQD